MLIAVNHVLKYEVKPESVAQLVGYDFNHNEIYEDDTIVNVTN